MPSHNGKYYLKKPPKSNNSDCKSIKSFFSKMNNSNTGSSSSSSPLDENSNNDRADTNLQNENEGATNLTVSASTECQAELISDPKK
jgi:hypothetical protein